MKFGTLVFTAALALHLMGCAQQYKKPLDRVSAQTETEITSREINPAGLAVPAGNTDPSDDHTPRRLESFTWDSVKHQLTWKVSRGESAGESYKPLTTDQYNIDMDKATMTFAGETRRFSEEEATNVQALMGLISQYAVESTVWWENGEGEPLGGNGSRVPQPPRKPKSTIPFNPRVVTRRSFEGLAAVGTEGIQVPSDPTQTCDKIADSLLALSFAGRPKR